MLYKNAPTLAVIMSGHESYLLCTPSAVPWSTSIDPREQRYGPLGATIDNGSVEVIRRSSTPPLLWRRGAGAWS